MRNRALSLVIAFLLVLGPSGFGLGRPLVARAAGEATMEITPSAGTYSTARDFSLDIMLHTGSSTINAARSEFTYDPAQLTLVSINATASVLTLGAPTDYSTTPGGLSQVDINRAIIGDFTGDGLMATITFHPVAAGAIPVTLVMTKPATMPVEGSLMLTSVGSVNILTATTSGLYTLANPGMTLSPSTIAVTEGGAGSGYTAVLNAPPIADVTVTVTPDAQTTEVPTTLSFTAGNWATPQTVAVNAVDDLVAEGAHTGTLTHAVTSTDSSYNGIAVGSVTANITDNDFLLTYTAGTNGHIDGTSPQTVTSGGSGTAVTATANIGYHFVQWSDTSTANPRTDTNVTANISVTASFAINSYTVTFDKNGGTTEANPTFRTADYDTTVTLPAPPSRTGYTFAGWNTLANGTGTTFDATTHVTASLTVYAQWTLIPTYTVTYNSNGGTGAQMDLLGPYAAGATVTVLGQGTMARTGYTFSGWNTAANGSGTAYAASATFTMGAANVTLYAQWTINTCTLSTGQIGIGTVSKNPGQASYDYGTVVQLTATPDPGWHFTGWSGDVSGSTNPTSIIMDANKTAIATFTINEYVLTINLIGSGLVAMSPDQATHAHGTSVTLTATPATGYAFTGWSGALTGTANPASITMDADKTVTATFTGDLIVHYYTALLDRDPEEAGYSYWRSEITRIQSLGIDVREGYIALARFFLTSPEYLAKNATPEAYVRDLYECFFNRVPASWESTYWTDYMAQGMSRDNVMNWFVYSPEFATYMTGILGSNPTRPENNLVNDLYRGFLNRLPDTAGFGTHLTVMRAAQASDAAAVRSTTLAIVLNFMSGPEYTLRARANAEFIEDCYNGILRRGALPSEIQGWVDFLTAGATRTEVLTGFVNSAEFQARVDQVIAAGPFIP